MHDKNSPENEAEKIVAEIWDEERAAACPEGSECAVHFRKDREVVSPENEYIQMVTYSGDYVVITDDNPDLDTGVPMALLYGTKMPDFWETSIYHVGQGTIADLIGLDRKVKADCLRYRTTHNDYEYAKGIHEVTVQALQQEMIDVSKPLPLEDI
jgi:hypothetical protein